MPSANQPKTLEKPDGGEEVSWHCLLLWFYLLLGFAWHCRQSVQPAAAPLSADRLQ
jgi:hypothetical protein